MAQNINIGNRSGTAKINIQTEVATITQGGVTQSVPANYNIGNDTKELVVEARFGGAQSSGNPQPQTRTSNPTDETEGRTPVPVESIQNRPIPDSTS